MKKILFVDDDLFFLHDLQRMLSRMRHEWEMFFVTGGPEALGILARQSVDVIVSDIRMPEMDGAELLTRVRDEYPNVVRIIMSGEVPHDAVMNMSGRKSRDPVWQSIRVAHRQLTKPCDTDTLRYNVQQACALRNLVLNNAVRGLVSRLESVPSLPAAYQAMQEELESDEPSLIRIGELIASDMAMTAKILQMVNSALFGLRHTVDSPTQAVVLLGLETVRGLVLTAHVFSSMVPETVEVLGLEELWLHSQETAALARQIARAENAPPKVVEYAGTAGMLHDIGKLVLACCMPDTYKEALLSSQQQGLPFQKVEAQMFAAGHAEIGAYLLGLWGLPDVLVEAVAWHHRPRDFSGNTFCPLTAVHVADALLSEAQREPGETDPSWIDRVYVARLRLYHRLPVWRRLVTVARPRVRGA